MKTDNKKSVEKEFARKIFLNGINIANCQSIYKPEIRNYYSVYFFEGKIFVLFSGENFESCLEITEKDLYKYIDYTDHSTISVEKAVKIMKDFYKKTVEAKSALKELMQIVEMSEDSNNISIASWDKKRWKKWQKLTE